MLVFIVLQVSILNGSYTWKKKQLSKPDKEIRPISENADTEDSQLAKSFL